MKTSSSARRPTTDRLGFGPAVDALALLVLVGLAACAAKGAPASVPGNGGPPVGQGRLRSTPEVEFSFDSLDDRPLSTDSTRGQPTLIAFVTTASLPAQAQVDFLVAMARRDADHVHYAVVALEHPENRELVEMYTKALAIPFPVAMADAQTLAGAGPFGDVRGVPVTVLLDRSGRVVWRVAGRVAKSDEVRAAMRGL